MEITERMNILVLGNSGAGKSTLIKAVSGKEVETGGIEANTSKIGVYEADIWPLRFIDTKGFEFSWRQQMITIHQVRNYTKKLLKSKTDDADEKGIDVVWYCIDAQSKKVFGDCIDMMNKSIKKWKNIPVFVVLTKSYSKVDTQENINSVMMAFAKKEGVNLQKVIPIVAESYPVTEDIIVEPKGLDELCNETLNSWETAKRISEENRIRMILEQKRYTVQAVITASTAAAVTVGAVPIPFADSLILVPLETALAKGVFKCYGVNFSQDLIVAIVGSAAITNVAKAALSALKTIPNIAGSVINAVVAGFFVAALGESVAAVAEAMYSGKIDENKIDEIVEFVSQKLSNNPIIGYVVKYFIENATSLKDMSSKDIYKLIFSSFKEMKK